MVPPRQQPLWNLVPFSYRFLSSLWQLPFVGGLWGQTGGEFLLFQPPVFYSCPTESRWLETFHDHKYLPLSLHLHALSLSKSLLLPILTDFVRYLVSVLFDVTIATRTYNGMYKRIVLFSRHLWTFRANHNFVMLSLYCDGIVLNFDTMSKKNMRNSCGFS